MLLQGRSGLNLQCPGAAEVLMVRWGRPTLPPAPHSDAHEAIPALGRPPSSKVWYRLANGSLYSRGLSHPFRIRAVWKKTMS
jgi:hypothetical protein